MPCSVAVGHCCFGGPCCLHLEGEVTAARKKGAYIYARSARRGGDWGLRTSDTCSVFENKGLRKIQMGGMK